MRGGRSAAETGFKKIHFGGILKNTPQNNQKQPKTAQNNQKQPKTTKTAKNTYLLLEMTRGDVAAADAGHPPDILRQHKALGMPSASPALNATAFFFTGKFPECSGAIGNHNFSS